MKGELVLSVPTTITVGNADHQSLKEFHMTKPRENITKQHADNVNVNVKDIPASTHDKEPSDSGKKPGTTSGNEDYGSTEREPLDGHSRENEKKPRL